MNAQVWMVALLVAAILPAHSVAAAADAGVAGKWSTEAGRYLAKRKEAEDSIGVRDVPIFDAGGGLRGRGSRGGGGPATMSRGNGNGRGAAGGGRGAPGGFGNSPALGGNNGAGMNRGNSGTFGNSRLGNNGVLGNNGLDTMSPGLRGALAQMIPLDIPEGRSFTMDLKVDKKNKITGSVVAYDYDGEVTEEKMKIEDGVLTGGSFTFSTTRKVKDLKFLYKWKGEQTSQNTIRLVIVPPSGQPGGEPESIVFRRDQ